MSALAVSRGKKSGSNGCRRFHKRQTHRKAEFLVEDEHGLAPHRKAATGVARPRLIEREATQRRTASGKESLRQGDDRWSRPCSRCTRSALPRLWRRKT